MFTLVELFLTVVVFVFWTASRKLFGKKWNLPPGPIPWPIIGNTIELALADSKYPFVAMQKMAEKYGDVMTLKLGVHNMVVISSFEAMKAILTKKELVGRYELPFVRDRAFGKQLGIVWGNGEMWQEMRRFTMRGLRNFGLGKPLMMDSIYQKELPEIISFIKESIKSNDGIWNLETREISASVVSILWTIVGGYKFPKGNATVENFMILNKRQMDVFGHDNPYTPFPFLRTLAPKLVHHDKHMLDHKEVQQFITNMVECFKERRANRTNTEAQNFI